MAKFENGLPGWVRLFITGIVAIGITFGALQTDAFAPTINTEVVNRPEFTAFREESRRAFDHINGALKRIQEKQEEIRISIGKLDERSKGDNLGNNQKKGN